MKLNLLNKVWLRVGIIVAVMTSAFAGTAWAGTELYYSLVPTRGSLTNYTSNENLTSNGIEWNVQGYTQLNNNRWRLGGRSLSGINRSISSRTAIGEIINQVILNVGDIEKGNTTFGGNLTVNSLTLTVASDINFSQNVQTITSNTSVTANSTHTFNGNWPAGSYYKFTFNITTSGFFGIETNDKYVEFLGAEFKAPYVDTPVISGTQVFDPSTEVSISCPTSGANIQYTLDDGLNWHDYNGEPFTLTQTTTVKAKATKEGMVDSHVATKTFCHEEDVKIVTWDLTASPTGGNPTIDLLKWTTTTSNEYFAEMTLGRNGSSTTANNWVGGINGRTDTGFYPGQLLTVSPLPGYEIAYVEFICTNSTSGLTGTWTNATASVVDGTTTVKVTPDDLTTSISKVISAETHVTGVIVHYFPVTSPYIAMVDIPRNVTSAAANGTLEVYYSDDVYKGDAQVVVEDENNQTVAWLHVVPNTDNTVLSYTIDANTTTANRIAYIKVSSGNISSNRITVTQAAAYVLENSGNNNGLINLHDGELCSVILDGRTFSTGKWYTLCLPFDLTIAGSPLAGADARELDTENTRIEAKTLKLEFTSVDELKAGTPYIIRWESGDPIVNPAFANVTISSGKNDAVCDLENNRGIQFVGTYASNTYTEVDQSKLFISSNKIYYVGEGTTIGAQRAYFQLYGFIYNGTGTTDAGIKEFGITLLDEDPTGIEDVNVNLNDNESIYNLSGQRINKMQKGINIVNGKKIFVK